MWLRTTRVPESCTRTPVHQLPPTQGRELCLACFLLPVLQPAPLGNQSGLCVPGLSVHYWSGTPGTRMLQHLQAGIPGEAPPGLEPPPTLTGYLDPGAQSRFHGQEGKG